MFPGLTGQVARSGAYLELLHNVVGALVRRGLEGEHGVIAVEVGELEAVRVEGLVVVFDELLCPKGVSFVVMLGAAGSQSYSRSSRSLRGRDWSVLKAHEGCDAAANIPAMVAHTEEGCLGGGGGRIWMCCEQLCLLRGAGTAFGGMLLRFWPWCLRHPAAPPRTSALGKGTTASFWRRRTAGRRKRLEPTAARHGARAEKRRGEATSGASTTPARCSRHSIPALLPHLAAVRHCAVSRPARPEAVAHPPRWSARNQAAPSCARKVRPTPSHVHASSMRHRACWSDGDVTPAPSPSFTASPSI